MTMSFFSSVWGFRATTYHRQHNASSSPSTSPSPVDKEDTITFWSSEDGGSSTSSRCLEKDQKRAPDDDEEDTSDVLQTSSPFHHARYHFSNKLRSRSGSPAAGHHRVRRVVEANEMVSAREERQRQERFSRTFTQDFNFHIWAGLEEGKSSKPLDGVWTLSGGKFHKDGTLHNASKTSQKRDEGLDLKTEISGKPVTMSSSQCSIDEISDNDLSGKTSDCSGKVLLCVGWTVVAIFAIGLGFALVFLPYLVHVRNIRDDNEDGNISSP